MVNPPLRFRVAGGAQLINLSHFGILGYVLIKCGCEPAPLLLGFVLGPLPEEYLRRALIISRGERREVVFAEEE